MLVMLFGPYTRSEDGQSFANKLTVMGANFSIGTWVDQDSIDEPLADNYVGRIIEARTIRDETLTTNEQCELRAAEIAAAQKLSVRRKTTSFSTKARISPYVLYEPHLVSFDAIHEPGLPDDLEVKQVTLDFSDGGTPTYNFTLGDPKPIRQRPDLLPERFHKANVYVSPGGKIETAGPPTTLYITTPGYEIRGESDLYVADPSELEGEPQKIYLPPTKLFPGYPVTIKVPSTATGTVEIYANQRDGRVDAVDGEPFITLSPGESTTIQSSGEHDQTGLGGQWHTIGEVALPATTTASINLPTSGGSDPVSAGLGVPVRVDFDGTIQGVGIILMTSVGPVSDTASFNIIRIRDLDVQNISTSDFGPSGSPEYEDTTLTGWSTGLLEGDWLILEVVAPPSSATRVGVSLKVLKAA